MPARHSLIVLALFVGLGAFVSCDKRSSSITGPTSTGNKVRLEIVAPPTIEPGASVQLRANLIHSNGSVEDVSGQVDWASTDPGVIAVSATGVAASVERGEATITVRYQTFASDSTRIMVIPAGTFRLGGRITDGAFPLQDVTLTVTAGIGERLRVISNANGVYNIYGVRGPVSIRAAKDGYLDRNDELDVVEHRSLDFEMTPRGRRLDLEGVYVLTLEAAGCAERLVENARRRVYEARVDQEGQALAVRLSGADLVVVEGHGDRFGGAIGPDNVVTFKIGESFFMYYDYYTSPQPGLVERVTESTTLAVNGRVRAKGTSTAISGTLVGTIGLVPSITPPFWPFSAYCHSDQHRFDMQRR